MDPNKKTPKNAKNKICEYCDFACGKQSEWTRHIMRSKHIHNANPNNPNKNPKGLDPNSKKYICLCGKEYKHISTLCAHKKKCILKSDEIEQDKPEVNNKVEIDTSIIMELLKQNQEFKAMIIELTSKGVGSSNTNNNSHNTTTNNNNKFNISVFLNEKCKDAMNIMDFVNSLQLQLSDLERVGELGYVEGISKIFINGLKQLDVCKRPVHCSDIKRETLYVKDKDVWEKETDEKDRLKLAIRHISKNNLMQLQEWKDQNPEHRNLDSKVHDKYVKIRSEALGGVTTEDDEKYYNKIIKRVANATIIEKES